jgi:hypothetical protein
MPDLLIRIKKKSDGSAALSCMRADGSVTWQRQEGQLGTFFPLHDLTHYAVETVLGFRRAFYGLLAEGWDISDFAKPGAARRMPADAGLAELIVGFLDLERATSVVGTADEMNAKIQSFHTDRGLPPTAFRLTDAQMARIRALRSDLFAQWRAVPAGETIELPFEPATSAVEPGRA